LRRHLGVDAAADVVTVLLILVVIALAGILGLVIRAGYEAIQQERRRRQVRLEQMAAEFRLQQATRSTMPADGRRNSSTPTGRNVVAQEPERLLDRLVGACVTLLIGALALDGAVWLLRAIFPDLIIVAVIVATIWGLIVWLKNYHSRW
jgi:Flp pilus assembly protein TadB